MSETMQAKIYPAKRVKLADGSKTTLRLSEPVLYYCPTAAEIAAHLAKEGAMDLAEGKEAQEYTEQTGLPAYSDEWTAWIQNALNSQAQVKVRSAYTLDGDTDDTLKLSITGTVPQSSEDLLASERSGGAYMAQKAAFLKGFAAYAEGNIKGHKRIVSALARASLQQTPRKAWALISECLESYAATIDEAEYSVYLRSVRNQLGADDTADEWDDLPD